MLLLRLLSFIFILLSLGAGAQDSTVPPPVQQPVERPAVRQRTEPRRPAASPAQRISPARQLQDSLRLDSLRRDSIARAQPVYYRFDTLALANHPYFKIKNPVKVLSSTRQWQGKEPFFYAAIVLLLFFAVTRNNFNRYMNDLFRLFFRTTIRQRQVKEQLMQSPFPSLLLNILFFLSGALFISLVFRYNHFLDRYDFWLLFLYCLLGLVLIYLGKFLVLKLWGWLFDIAEAVNTYIFIVFTTNKVIGILLIPFTILIAFTTGTLNETAMILSLVLIAALFLYRYFMSYLSVRKELRISFFHFMLYLLGLEIVPLLLINKLLLTYFS